MSFAEKLLAEARALDPFLAQMAAFHAIYLGPRWREL
ncbi:hypothetical protein FHT44_005024 [Mycolicibacterium sp. BK634]|nr:hypothetical protein [Mycolicibacterium sp. BK634]